MVLLKHFSPLNLRCTLFVLFLSLGEHFGRLLDLCFEDCDVSLQGFHFKQTLLCLVKVYVFMYVRCQTVLAMTSRELTTTSEVVIASYRKTPSILEHAAVSLSNRLPTSQVLVSLCRYSSAITATAWWHRHVLRRRWASANMLTRQVVHLIKSCADKTACLSKEAHRCLEVSYALLIWCQL